MCFPWPHILSARISNIFFKETKKPRHTALIISNKEEGLSKFHWKTNSRELLSSSNTSSVLGQGAWKGTGDS